MSQAVKDYHKTINDWRSRQFKIHAYRHQLEEVLDPAAPEWEAAFYAMTQLEEQQEENKLAFIDARQHVSTIY